jgi:hypothetical protein
MRRESQKLSRHVIVGQEIGSLPINDLQFRLLGRMDVLLVEQYLIAIPLISCHGFS